MTFAFTCDICVTTIEPTPVDTLQFQSTRVQNYGPYKAILEKAGDDPVNPKAYRKCAKCSATIARQVRIGSELRLINTCMKCKHAWIDGTQETDVE